MEMHQWICASPSLQEINFPEPSVDILHLLLSLNPAPHLPPSPPTPPAGCIASMETQHFLQARQESGAATLVPAVALDAAWAAQVKAATAAAEQQGSGDEVGTSLGDVRRCHPCLSACVLGTHTHNR